MKDECEIRVKQINPSYREVEGRFLSYEITATLEENINIFLKEIGDRFVDIKFTDKERAYIIYTL